MTLGYVHGYTPRETRRLGDQAQTLSALLHGGSALPAGARVLEVGCGVGAQTPHLLAAAPGVRVTALDVSAESLVRARERLSGHPGRDRVEFVCADLFDLPPAAGLFDHVFVCFVLEHLAEPVLGLEALRALLRPGGTITVVEGDHGSALFHPPSVYAEAVVAALVRLQARDGGNALIGRELQPLLAAAGFTGVDVEPRTVYADRSRPHLVEGFVRNTFIAMVESVRERARAEGIVAPADWERGIADLERTAEDGGTFHYAFFKAAAANPPAPGAVG
ncbi:methyltransferase [Streptomonospora litoralis]|uniref:Demethylrebeccamycin-D-glucose O-methyltransferase n=1 Tax=Streptomonospora litoralis TaxID=2498135 RepID=A0A4P6Q612_9ACTN|nr:methyltransferase [Streptomonospora litoralis]QBI54334.1 Demethylrebeccamycin-D-glucose O-methyltransferase [Streptomonospora litoralis]